MSVKRFVEIFSRRYFGIGSTLLPGILALFIFFTGSCDYYSRFKKERAEKAAKLKGDIVIAVVDTSAYESLFVKGVQMAVEQINARNGILGKKIRILHYNDEGSEAKAMSIAREIAKNTDVVAVLGHDPSDLTISVSIPYELSGTLFISPWATQPELTQYPRSFIFRNVPSDKDAGKWTAEFAKFRKFNNIVSVFNSESAARRSAIFFHDSADDLKLDIISSKSYAGPAAGNFKKLIAQVMNKEFDCLFLGDGLPTAARFIKELRAMGMDKPIIGNDFLDSPEFWGIAGKSADGTIIPTVFNPNLPGMLVRQFVESFRKEYGVIPDTWAAQGYDSVSVMAYAMSKSGSVVPMVVGNTLRFLKDWNGVAGNYAFGVDGGITKRAYHFKVVQGGKFKFLDSGGKREINLFEADSETTLRMSFPHSIPTIDPGLALWPNSIELVQQLFLGLTDFAPETYEVVPRLAEKWTVSEDGRTYTFQMRKNARWTNGEPVTAHDVVWAIRRNIDPRTNCPNVSLLYPLKNAREINTKEISDVRKIGVTAVDDFTLKFELEKPSASFPAMAGLPVYRPLHGPTLVKYGNDWATPEKVEKSVKSAGADGIQTNGPYEPAAWAEGIVMILKKNDKYYDHEHFKKMIPEVRYYILPRQETVMSMYQRDALDIMGGIYSSIPASNLQRIMADSDLRKAYSRKPIFRTYSYYFDTKNPPVDNLLVRKAITAAIDKKLLIELARLHEQEPAFVFTPPQLLDLNSKDSKNLGIGFNTRQSAEWLSMAGYPGGKDFPDIIISHPDTKRDALIAEFVKDSLKYNLKVNVKLQPEGSTDAERAHMHQLDWIMDYPDPGNVLDGFFNPTNPDNALGWHSGEFVDIMDKARQTEETKRRRELYRRAEEILCKKECVVTPLLHNFAQYLVKPRVKGWRHMGFGGQHICDLQFKIR